MVSDYIRGVVSFIQVVNSGNFTLASENAAVSKSAMTKAVTALESRIGFQLLIRTTRTVVLTPEGKEFFDVCSQALSCIDEARERLVTHKDEPAGRIRIDMPVAFGRRWVLPVLLDIARSHPQIEMDMSFTDRRIDAIEDGVDLVIRVGDLDDTTSMVARQLGVQSATLCAAPSYFERHPGISTLDDLDHHNCIRFGSSPRFLPWGFVSDRGEDIAKIVKGRLAFNNSEAILDAALSGCGPALISTWLVQDDIRVGRLKALLPDLRTRGFPVYAVWPQKAFPSKKTRLIVDELVRRFMPKPPWSENL